MKSPSRIKVTEDEHRLIQRYREQCRSFNDGVSQSLAAALEVLDKPMVDQHEPEDGVVSVTRKMLREDISEAITKLLKDTL